MLVFIIVFMPCLPLSLWGILCIQDCGSGCSDNHVGCTEAGLYNGGNSGDIQSGVRGPSINLTGWRSCQEYERMLWSMLLNGRVSRCAHTATVPPSTTRAPQGGACSARLWSAWPRTWEREEGAWHYSPALPSDCLPRRSLRKSV